NIPHCCINNTKSFILYWLQEVIEVRQPDSEQPLTPMKAITGWYGSVRPCLNVYKDHWGLPLWNVCDAHIVRTARGLPSGEMPAGFFLTESLAREWLAYVLQSEHPKNSFPRPQDPSFGAPKESDVYDEATKNGFSGITTRSLTYSYRSVRTDQTGRCPH